MRLPLKSQNPELGDSRSIAVARWLRAESRLVRDGLQAAMYHGFLRKYETLEHMEIVPNDDLKTTRKYFMPHHGVLKRSHDTAEVKIRVVFNASQASTNGRSLNDEMLTGPKLQEDLWIVLTRWRFFRVVFITDVVKMFRQILVSREDADLQLIVWQETPKDELRTYRLLTVTYGTAAAPFLANRVLLELAQQYKSQYPLGTNSIENHKYVDDFLAGGDSLEAAAETKRQLTSLLAAAGISLSKWATNCPELLADTLDTSEEKQLKLEGCVSTLGTAWLPCQDCFTFKVTQIKRNHCWTKRMVLSETAKLFDPLGWLGPVVIRAKALLQDLWLSGASWDDLLPIELLERWELFIEELPELTSLKIPRWIGSTPSSKLQLHAFSDASERAYAACIYIVATNNDGKRTASLLLGKTKVAPIKTLSIPRLELCGAYLAARVVREVQVELKQDRLDVYCWTDSKVVLSWLSSHPSRWNTFVSTRAGEISTLLPTTKWRHVPSKQNPADLATRGTSPSELSDSKLWWTGPPWLVTGNFPEDSIKSQPEEVPERRTPTKTSPLSQAITEGEEYLLHFSYSRLIRVTAYCLRFIRNAKAKQQRQETAPALTSTDLRTARNALIRKTQAQYFSAEVRALTRNMALPRKSTLLSLRPLLDAEGLLRLGGRLALAALPYSEKHPLILPKDSALSKLLIEYAHQRTLHGGRQLTLSFLLRSFWIIHAKSAIRLVLKNCIRCARFESRPQAQLMGCLPTYRVEEARPFLRSGVDYAGPLNIRTSKGRGQRAYKGYLCIFVCMAIKAVHIEIASDLTSAAFLAAYKRFVARRGRCAKLHSDNGTNFHGADAELQRLFKEASTLSGISQYLENDGTKWSFIPPGAPHFGGLWEAAVKAAKHHLRRIIGEATLTYEELSTLTSQVEACLNSRPLFVPSSDASDLPAITPVHYLIGSTLVAPPEPYDVKDNYLSPLNRRVLITRMRNQFWHSWRHDYLHRLQQRAKWREHLKNLSVGDIVLVVNENTPPTRWPLGQITATFPGVDGLVRVVEIRTANSLIKRPTAKVCRLPVFNESSTEKEYQDNE